MRKITEYWRRGATKTDREVICALYETDSGLEVRVVDAIDTDALLRAQTVVDDIRGRQLADEWRLQLLAGGDFHST